MGRGSMRWSGVKGFSKLPTVAAVAPLEEFIGGYGWVWGGLGDEVFVGVGMGDWVWVEGVGGSSLCVSHMWVRILIPPVMVLQDLHFHSLFGLAAWWLRMRCFSIDVTAAMSLA